MPFSLALGHCQLLLDNEGTPTPAPYSVLLHLFKTGPNLQSFRLFPDTKDLQLHFSSSSTRDPSMVLRIF